MGSVKWFFMSRYRKLLHHIKAARDNEQRLILPNGVVLDFAPGHEYDHHMMFSSFPRDPDGESFFKKYADKIGQVVHMDVYDCFGGDVKILAVGADEVFVEIVDVRRCYGCQKEPSVGSKYWVVDWEIPEGVTIYDDSVFQDVDLPF